MTLKQYRKKRNFRITQEPSGSSDAVRPKAISKTKSKTNLEPIFVIQKHAASRLHYDFRLEINGVLASWAVPKGPSLDPHERRLAVHVEDHPLEYANFEGTIPTGEYGAGEVIVWDTGYWLLQGEDSAEALRKGHLKFTLNGHKLKGIWNLVRMRTAEKRDNWLLIKEEDRFAIPTNRGDILVEKPNSVLSSRRITKERKDRESENSA